MLWSIGTSKTSRVPEYMFLILIRTALRASLITRCWLLASDLCPAQIKTGTPYGVPVLRVKRTITK